MLARLPGGRREQLAVLPTLDRQQDQRHALLSADVAACVCADLDAHGEKARIAGMGRCCFGHASASSCMSPASSTRGGFGDVRAESNPPIVSPVDVDALLVHLHALDQQAGQPLLLFWGTTAHTAPMRCIATTTCARRAPRRPDGAGTPAMCRSALRRRQRLVDLGQHRVLDLGGRQGPTSGRVWRQGGAGVAALVKVGNVAVTSARSSDEGVEHAGHRREEQPRQEWLDAA